MPHLCRVLLLGCICCSIGADQPEAGPANRTGSDKEALAPIQAYVGQWKGVGQLRRGSNQGAWIEQSDWIWEFSDSRAGLVFTAPEARYYVAGHITAGDEPGVFEFTGTRPDGETRDRFRGELAPEGHLVLVAAADPRDDAAATGAVARITIRLVADGDRLILLYERRVAGTDRYLRLAEIGSTRQGSSFAKGSGQPECVVTGGLGTIEVEHEGKTYLVCCSGCRDLFLDDPETVLADYRARKAEEEEDVQR